MGKEEKTTLRRSIKAKVKGLSKTEKDERATQIWRAVEQDPHFASARCVLLFWSLPDEVDTHAFVERWHTKKRRLLPVVVGDSLEIRPYEGMAKMRLKMVSPKLPSPTKLSTSRIASG